MNYEFVSLTQSQVFFVFFHDSRNFLFFSQTAVDFMQDLNKNYIAFNQKYSKKHNEAKQFE